jgi:hypothetical protein
VEDTVTLGSDRNADSEAEMAGRAQAVPHHNPFRRKNDKCWEREGHAITSEQSLSLFGPPPSIHLGRESAVHALSKVSCSLLSVSHSSLFSTTIPISRQHAPRAEKYGQPTYAGESPDSGASNGLVERIRVQCGRPVKTLIYVLHY